MSRKLLFVFNPTAGRGTIRQKQDDIVRVFSEAGYEVTVHPTTKANDARETIPQFAGLVDLVVVAGGDGTINEAFSAMAGVTDGPALGVIPAGSTNDFANSIGIRRNLVDAARDIVNGEEKLIDVGLFNGQAYAYIAGFGLFTDISYSTAQSAKNLFGYFAYLWEAGRELFNVPRYRMHYEMNGEEGDGEFIYGMITNSMSVAGVKYLPGRGVLMDDGLFEVTLIRHLKNPLELGEVLVCLLSGEQAPAIIRRKTDHIRIVSEKPLSWTLDGEDGGLHTEVEIKTLKQQVKIMTPANLMNLQSNLPEPESTDAEEDMEDEYN